MQQGDPIAKWLQSWNPEQTAGSEPRLRPFNARRPGTGHFDLFRFLFLYAYNGENSKSVSEAIRKIKLI